jgi:hypothetical protein
MSDYDPQEPVLTICVRRVVPTCAALIILATLGCGSVTVDHHATSTGSTSGAGAGGASSTTGTTSTGTGGGGGAATSSGSSTTGSGGGSTCPPFAPIWAQRYGDGGLSDGNAVALDAAGDVFVTGRDVWKSDFGDGPSPWLDSTFVLALGPLGEHHWFRSFGAAYNVAVGEQIAVDGAGNVLFTGRTNKPIDFGGGPRCVDGPDQQVFLVKLDSQGNHVYSVCFGTMSASTLYDNAKLAVDAVGNAILVGRVFGGFDFGAGVMVGEGAVVAKFDPAGQILWAHGFGPVPYFGVAATDSGNNIVLTGAMVSPVDFGGGPIGPPGFAQESMFLVKLDSNGGHVWSKAFSAPDDLYGTAVAIGPADRIAATGVLHGSADLGGGPLPADVGVNNVYLAAFDATGAHLWSRSSIGSALGVAWDTLGSVSLAVSFNVPVDLGCGTLKQPPDSGFALGRYDETGIPLGSLGFSADDCNGLAARGGRMVVAGTMYPSTPLNLGGGPVGGKGPVFVGVFGP